MQSGADRTMWTGLELEPYLKAVKAGIGTATRDEMDDGRRPVDEKGNVNEHKHGIVYCKCTYNMGCMLIFIKVFEKRRKERVCEQTSPRTITANRTLLCRARQGCGTSIVRVGMRVRTCRQCTASLQSLCTKWCTVCSASLSPCPVLYLLLLSLFL